MILVAAGYGSVRLRDGKPFPKLLEPVGGIPMVLHPLRAAEGAGVRSGVVVVNPHSGRQIRDAIHRAQDAGYLAMRISFVEQPMRLGSADAVLRAIPEVGKLSVMPHALVMYGDMPCWRSETIRELLHQAPGTIVSMVTLDRGEDPVLARYGRVIHDARGGMRRIVEVDAPECDPAIRAVQRVNPSLWAWNMPWLQRHIPLVPPVHREDRMGDERHMPPLISMAYETKPGRVKEIVLARTRAREAYGVNTLEELCALASVPA